MRGRDHDGPGGKQEVEAEASRDDPYERAFAEHDAGAGEQSRGRDSGPREPDDVGGRVRLINGVALAYARKRFGVSDEWHV